MNKTRNNTSKGNIEEIKLAVHDASQGTGQGMRSITGEIWQWNNDSLVQSVHQTRMYHKWQLWSQINLTMARMIHLLRSRGQPADSKTARHITRYFYEKTIDHRDRFVRYF